MTHDQPGKEGSATTFRKLFPTYWRENQTSALSFLAQKGTICGKIDRLREQVVSRKVKAKPGHVIAV